MRLPQWSTCGKSPAAGQRCAEMPSKKSPESPREKPAQPGYTTEADLERLKRIAYQLEMKYGWEIKTDSESIEELAKAIRQTEPPKWPDAKPVKLYKPRKR